MRWKTLRFNCATFKVDVNPYQIGHTMLKPPMSRNRAQLTLSWIFRKLPIINTDIKPTANFLVETNYIIFIRTRSLVARSHYSVDGIMYTYYQTSNRSNSFIYPTTDKRYRLFIERAQRANRESKKCASV